ncbi:hypothetical protein PSTT_08121 [Puccinia striiformis]|uniref:Uncharacterized protein n=1 Tax=Puccinia striiformis TaxID=27350 RepID=A0A2S4VDX9_9BASI|nr:hypothetical protein PSTT_08121 [Puccinia striiformis]
MAGSPQGILFADFKPRIPGDPQSPFTILTSRSLSTPLSPLATATCSTHDVDTNVPTSAPKRAFLSVFHASSHTSRIFSMCFVVWALVSVVSSSLPKPPESTICPRCHKGTLDPVIIGDAVGAPPCKEPVRCDQGHTIREGCNGKQALFYKKCSNEPGVQALAQAARNQAGNQAARDQAGNQAALGQAGANLAIH